MNTARSQEYVVYVGYAMSGLVDLAGKSAIHIRNQADLRSPDDATAARRSHATCRKTATPNASLILQVHRNPSRTNKYTQWTLVLGKCVLGYLALDTMQLDKIVLDY